MKIHSSHTATQAAAHCLSQAIETHKNTPILLLLAGGSSLQVLNDIDTTHINEYTTIMMMDERFSSDPQENNFLQFTQTFFYTTLSNTQCNFIPSIPEQEESHQDFAKRIEGQLTQYHESNPDATVIALFGVGTDGHTAAIFPMPLTDFTDTYGTGNVYTWVKYDQNPFSLRSSITPKYINQYIDKTIVYAVGAQKTVILREMQNPYELHELPAHIHQNDHTELFTDLAQ